MVHNIHLLTKNLEVHNHNTRSANNFHLPITNLTKYQKAAYCTGSEIFNYLTTDIKNVANEIQVFKKTLKRFFLITHFILMINILMLVNDTYSWVYWFYDVTNILLCNHCTWSIRKVSRQLILKKVTDLEQWYLSPLQSTPLGTSHTYPSVPSTFQNNLKSPFSESPSAASSRSP